MIKKSRLVAKFFHLIWLFKRPMTLGVRVLVEDGEGRVLLVRHSYVPGWHLPGGGVETAETCEAAAIKEVWEEAALRLTKSPSLVSVHLNRNISKRDHVLLYRAGEYEREGEFVPNREILEARFFDRNALPQGVTQSTLKRFAEIYDGVAANPIW